MEYLKALQELVGWFLKLLSLRQDRDKERKQRVIEYIDKCLEHLQRLLYLEKYTEGEIEYSRIFLKKAYQEIYVTLDGIASARECDIIKKSLMGGRIYYHAAKYGAVTDKQIKIDYEDRFYAYVNQIYDQKVFRLNSNEPVLKELVKDGIVLSKNDRDSNLSKLKTVCREDAERIESLREILKSRKVIG